MITLGHFSEYTFKYFPSALFLLQRQQDCNLRFTVCLIHSKKKMNNKYTSSLMYQFFPSYFATVIYFTVLIFGYLSFQFLSIINNVLFKALVQILDFLKDNWLTTE